MHEFKVVNENKGLEFDPRKTPEPHEMMIRQVQRYAALRQSTLQYSIRMRSKVQYIIREYMNKLDFVDIETPSLFKPTSEGAKEFIVPVENDMEYALAQSPQQFKQLLMVGGFTKYYQICKCWRNEPYRKE